MRRYYICNEFNISKVLQQLFRIKPVLVDEYNMLTFGHSEKDR